MRTHERFVRLLLLFVLSLSAVMLSAQTPQKQNGAKSPAAVVFSPAEAEKGKKVFEDRCAICHYSASAAKKIGPGLKDLSKRGKFADGRKVDDASLRAWIEKGGKDMPGFADSLKTDQIRALITYMKML